MAKKKGTTRRKKQGVTIPLAAVAGFAPMAKYCYDIGWKQAGIEGVGVQALYTLTGYDAYHNNWSAHGLKNGLIPIIGGLLVHKYVGGKLGINRMLAKAGVPLLRI